MSDQLRPQRRARRIAMAPAELDAFLGEQRTCRVATTGADGPHATPLWFVWHERGLWLYSLVRSRRWADLAADPRVGVVVDAGEDYGELRGAEILGRVEVTGTVPRTDTPDERVAAIEAAFATKYHDGQPMPHDGRHGWLRAAPTKIVTWDFRKLAG